MPAIRIHPGSTALMGRTVRRVVPLAVLSLLFLAAAGMPTPAGAVDAAKPAGAVRNPNSRFPIFFDLFGTWRGEGVVGTLPSKVEMTWNPAIDGRFVRLSWKNDMTSKTGEPLHFEGEGTYRPMPDEEGNHTGTWFDSQGKTYPLYGRVAGDSLTTVWGKEGDTQGRTTYRFLDRGTIRVHDEIRRGGNWQSFGLTTLVKQPATATPTN